MIHVNNLYKIDVDGYATLMGKAGKVVSEDEGELWHRRSGHIHKGAMKVMQHISMRITMGTLVQKDTHKECTMGKYTKATFHEKENRETEILERVHSDMCGPFSTTSTSKHGYYVIFVHDFSRKCWICFMYKKY